MFTLSLLYNLNSGFRVLTQPSIKVDLYGYLQELDNYIQLNILVQSVEKSSEFIKLKIKLSIGFIKRNPPCYSVVNTCKGRN